MTLYSSRDAAIRSYQCDRWFSKVKFYRRFFLKSVDRREDWRGCDFVVEYCHIVGLLVALVLINNEHCLDVVLLFIYLFIVKLKLIH